MAENSSTTEDFIKLDISDFPDFYNYKSPLEQGLWVLWVAKEKLGIKKLTAEQIAEIIIDKEVSIDKRKISNSFNPAKGKIHISEESGKFFYEIMKEGKDYLISKIKKDLIRLFYFEPGKKFTSKSILSENILSNIRGELKIVDPYCGDRTLDVLKNLGNDVHVKFITKIENINKKEKNSFLRALKDFNSEKPDIKFRNYYLKDIHDRYMINSNTLIILGHSIKDLGNKESFAMVLDKNTNINIFEDLNKVFDERWENSKEI